MQKKKKPVDMIYLVARKINRFCNQLQIIACDLETSSKLANIFLTQMNLRTIWGEHIHYCRVPSRRLG